MGLIAASNHHSHHLTRKIYLLCNYVILGAASSCIFLNLSLRLIPSWTGFALILLHSTTIAGAVSGCTAAGDSSSSGKWYVANMAVTILTAIFQGSVSVLAFMTTSNFLRALKSYVREEDGAVILKMAGGLCALIFFLEWVVLVLAFLLRHYSFLEGNVGYEMNSKGRGKAGEDENLSNWPWPFQV